MVDINITSDDSGEQRFQNYSRFEVILWFLAKTKLLWGGAIVVYVIGVIMGWVPSPLHYIAGIDNRIVKAFTLSLLGVGTLYYPFAKSFVKKLVDVPKMVVFRVNIARTPIIRPYAGHPEKWDDVTVVSGEPAEFTVKGTVVKLVTDFREVRDVDPDGELADHFEAENYKPDEYIATGSWLGEASDTEIAHMQYKVEENRRRNNIYSRIGEKLVAKFESIADKAESQHHHDMAGKSREMNLFNAGEAVDEALQQSIPEYEEIDEGKPVSEIIQDEVSRQVEEMNRGETDSVIPSGGDDE